MDETFLANTDDRDFSRLRWRCRRGMLELDLLLGRFVNEHYRELDGAGRTALSRLLDMPDSELLICLQGQADPADPELLSLVQRFR